MHYFDVEKLVTESWGNDGIYPTYVLSQVDKAYCNYNIVPVVYITNSIFKSENIRVESLAKKITTLIHQMNQQHFGKQFNTIQIDCDWTQSTRSAYFSLLQELKKNFCINATIRLHQIKYQSETGIPPVAKGTLMLYNMGDLKKMDENSIIDHKIVAQYINNSTSYPLPLDVALPLFSQTVIQNNNHQIKIIKDSQRENLQNPDYFRKTTENQYLVLKDTLFKGFYLSKDFTLKIEECSIDEVEQSYNIINNSQLQTHDILFYHLDSTSLKNINIETLINTL